MVRVLLFALWAGVVIYALADWMRVDAQDMPGKLPKPLWLILIVMTVPTFAIGAVAWVVVRVVQRVEARQRGEDSAPSLAEAVAQRWRMRSEGAQDSVVAPDDDPEFLFKLERDIARRRAEERREKERREQMSSDLEKMSEDNSDSAENSDSLDEKE